jgi:hypothetical protein
MQNKTKILLHFDIVGNWHRVQRLALHVMLMPDSFYNHISYIWLRVIEGKKKFLCKSQGIYFTYKLCNAENSLEMSP